MKKLPLKIARVSGGLLVGFICAGTLSLVGGRVNADVSPVIGVPDSESLLSHHIENPSPAVGSWVRPRLAVPLVKTPPTIDGVINDPCWNTALHITGFFRANSTTPVAQQTEAWICANRTHLYVAFHCLDSEPRQIKASETQRNGNVFGDDNVSIKLDSQNLHRSNSEFVLNSIGTQLQNIEGGTTDNVRWAGDWTAATKRTSDGWSAEFSIPFALLRYQKGASEFGIYLTRKLARESSYSSWPSLPSGGENQNVNFFGELTGLDPLYFAPRPTFLPYMLVSGGSTNAGRVGMDIKYPLTTTLTGLAAIFPDFATIEQDVANVNFSYTEKYVNDHRPFFAEGSGFMPYGDLFYSPRVPYVDEGVKVVGKQGAATIAALATNSNTHDKQKTVVLSGREDLGLYNTVEADLAVNQQIGQPNSQTAKLEGDFGWRGGRDSFNGLGVFLPSWQNGRMTGSKKYFFLNERGRPGGLAPFVDYLDVSPGFTNPLGFNPETDIRGGSINLEQYNQFDKGWLEGYDVGVSDGEYHHHNGELFRRFLNPFINLNDHRGISVGADWTLGDRPGIHDNTTHGYLGWGGKTLYQRGNLNYSTGRQDNQKYNFTTISQQVFVRRNTTAQLDVNVLTLGDTVTRQTVFTTTYRLGPARVIAARIVKQDNATDAFVSYGSRGRDGTDVFLVFGDANTASTVNKVTLKIVRAY